VVEPVTPGVDPAPGVPEANAAEPPPDPDMVEQLVRIAPTSLDVEVKLRAPGVLVVSEPWYPGWRATVDGKPAPMLRVDYALRGVALPAGRHVVEMAYESAPLKRGAWITLLALTGVTVITLWRARRRRRAAV